MLCYLSRDIAQAWAMQRTFLCRRPARPSGTVSLSCCPVTTVTAPVRASLIPGMSHASSPQLTEQPAVPQYDTGTADNRHQPSRLWRPHWTQCWNNGRIEGGCHWGWYWGCCNLGDWNCCTWDPDHLLHPKPLHLHQTQHDLSGWSGRCM